MKNTIVIVIGLLMSLQVSAQKYFTRTGITQFEASEKAFEPVEAINNSTTAILNTNTGGVAAQVFMAGFQFKNALMQEHFNENYMDTHKFPKATLKGQLEDFSKARMTTHTSFTLNGILTIKGIEKEIQADIFLKEENKHLHVSTIFSVRPEDFDINIPSIVRDKIAKEIQISVAYELVEKK
ncbi:MAG: YceI family protein [Saprospiraceae bacterium]|jgi:polyisoprenoid-binding protein YceI